MRDFRLAPYGRRKIRRLQQCRHHGRQTILVPNPCLLGVDVRRLSLNKPSGFFFNSSRFNPRSCASFNLFSCLRSVSKPLKPTIGLPVTVWVSVIVFDDKPVLIRDFFAVLDRFYLLLRVVRYRLIRQRFQNLFGCRFPSNLTDLPRRFPRGISSRPRTLRSRRRFHPLLPPNIAPRTPRTRSGRRSARRDQNRILDVVQSKVGRCIIDSVRRFTRHHLRPPRFLRVYRRHVRLRRPRERECRREKCDEGGAPGERRRAYRFNISASLQVVSRSIQKKPCAFLM